MTGRAHASLAARWRAYARTPFPLLVQLFMNRILHGRSGEEDELNLSLGLVLTLLAVPGGFISMFLFDKYGSLLRWLRGQTNFDPLTAALPDEYFFIVLSMVVTGGVALWWWDSIFPDRRDFANLVPLPIPTSRIFLANTAALLFLAGLFAIDVNAASSILFPAVVGASQPTLSFVVRFAAVHALVVVAASIFSFFAVFAMVGLLMLLLPFALFRRISLYIRSLILILLLAALSTSFLVPHLLLMRSSHSALQFLPSVWFLGWCQLLRGRASPFLAHLGRLAMPAVVSACLGAVATYTLSYRRCFVRLPELADLPPGSLGVRTAWIFRRLDRWILRTPVERAGYRFVLKTLLRNEAHALAFAGFASLGMVLASRALLAAFDGKGLGKLPSAELLSIPLILSYCLLIGIRLIFDIPANLQANWIFRLLLDKNADHSVALSRRLMLSFVLPWLFGIAFPIYVYFWGWTVALPHTALVAAWSWLLAEILLVRFRKLPFTCTYPPFEHSAVVVVIGYGLGFLAFAGVTSELEFDSLMNPAAGIVFVLVGVGVWSLIRRMRREALELDKQIIFEDIAAPQFEFLHLSDSGQGAVDQAGVGLYSRVGWPTVVGREVSRSTMPVIRVDDSQEQRRAFPRKKPCALLIRDGDGLHIAAVCAFEGCARYGGPFHWFGARSNLHRPDKVNLAGGVHPVGRIGLQCSLAAHHSSAYQVRGHAVGLLDHVGHLAATYLRNDGAVSVNLLLREADRRGARAGRTRWEWRLLKGLGCGQLPQAGFSSSLRPGEDRHDEKATTQHDRNRVLAHDCSCLIARKPGHAFSTYGSAPGEGTRQPVSMPNRDHNPTTVPVRPAAGDKPAYRHRTPIRSVQNLASCSIDEPRHISWRSATARAIMTSLIRPPGASHADRAA